MIGRQILVPLAVALSLSGSAPAGDVGAAGERVLSVFLEVPADALALTHGGKDAGLKPFPEGIKTLGATAIEHTLSLSARLRDADGNLIGLTSELEDFPAAPPQDGLMVWDTYWTVMIVGRGSLLLYERESLGPEVARIFSETLQGDKDWQGELTHPSSVGPLPSGRGVVAGGSGEFEGAHGSFLEIGTLRKFTTKGEITASIELRIWLDE